MIKIKIALTALSASIFISLPAFSQQDDPLNRQVDVSRDYLPDVDRAQKLPFAPVMSDTVSLRPDVDYLIRPTPWLGTFGVAAISPVRVSVADYSVDRPLWLRVAGGFPGQSLADVYFNSTGKGASSYGAYINHRGQFSKIKNDAGNKAKANMTTNRIGIFGKTRVGRRMSLGASLNYDYDLWTHYGWFPVKGYEYTLRSNNRTQSYSTPSASILFGHAFEDLSYFNFRMAADLYHISTRNDNKETGAKVGLQLGKMFGVHKLMLDAGFQTYNGGGAMDYYSDNIFSVRPSYGIETRRFLFDVGAEYIYDKQEEYGGKGWVIPHLDMRVKLGSGVFVPFVTLDGKIDNNGLQNTSMVNPYIFLFTAPAEQGVGHVVPRNTVSYDLKAGFSGSVGAHFGYELYGFADLYRHSLWFDHLFYILRDEGFWAYTEDRMTVYGAGLALTARAGGSFSFRLGGRYNAYSTRDLDKPIGMPDYQADLSVRYDHRKFYIDLGGELIGSRYFSESFILPPSYPDNRQAHRVATDYTEIYKQDAAFILNLEAGYRIRPNLDVFLLGRNLGNSKVYRFSHYRDQGVGISAGVKMVF